MYGYKQHVLRPKSVAVGVDSCATLAEGHVSVFGYGVLGIVALCFKSFDNFGHNLAAVIVLSEPSVGTLLRACSGQRRIAVSGFNQYLHRCIVVLNWLLTTVISVVRLAYSVHKRMIFASGGTGSGLSVAVPSTSYPP